MPSTKITPYTCLQCLRKPPYPRRQSLLFRRNISSSTANPHLPPPKAHAHLTSRRLISLHGSDASRFLQGLTTTNIPPYSQNIKASYSAFLNASGRVLHDVFIYPTAQSSDWTRRATGTDEEPGFLIEVDANEVESLAKHLKRHKLRAKVDVKVVEGDEWGVWSRWQGDGTNFEQREGVMGCEDRRGLSSTWREVLPSGKRPEDAGEEVSVGVYDLRRILAGVPEAQREILKESALPQESDMDYMGAIDFRKGCYVGQELTIRTHHTGVVRKRILPVQLYGVDEKMPEKLGYDQDVKLALPPRGANISRVDKKGRSAGKWIGGVGNVGLALCRLEIMTDTILTGEGSQWKSSDEFKVAWEAAEGENGGEVKIKAFVPIWHGLKADLMKEQLAYGRESRK